MFSGSDVIFQSGNELSFASNNIIFGATPSHWNNNDRGKKIETARNVIDLNSIRDINIVFEKKKKDSGSRNDSKTVQISILQEYKSVYMDIPSKRITKGSLHIMNAKNVLIVCMLGMGQLKIDKIPMPQNTSNVSMKN